MINKILSEFVTIDTKILKAIKICDLIALIICLGAIIILWHHFQNPVSYNTYKTGSLLFRAGLFLLVDSIISGFIFNRLKNN